MIQTFGDFIEDLPSSQEYLIIGFSTSSAPLKQRWRNNGLSADFLADYLTTFFPSCENEPDTRQRQIEMKGSVSYIANELLENAMKFNYEKYSSLISIQLYLYSEKIIFIIANNIDPQQVNEFQIRIDKLMRSDLEELYIQQLEKNAEKKNGDSSGLGLITILNDYQARMGWKFESCQDNPQQITLTTMVQLVV
jgi:hypothetical protein